MENQTIRVLKVEPGKAPYEKNIRNELEDMQAEVGGLIQILTLPDGTLLCCNEEGKTKQMEPNRTVGQTIICGSFFLAGEEPEEGELISLQEEEIAKLTKQFAEPEQFTGREPELRPHMTLMTFG